MSQISLPHSIISGDADNPTRDMANWTTIRDIINGNLDNANISATAAIAISKTALGTFTDWATYAPTWVQTETITHTVTRARYSQIGKVVTGHIHLVATGAGTATSNITFTIPVTAAASGVVVGSGYVYNADITTIYSGIAKLTTTSAIALIRDGTNGSAIGINPDFSIASSDEIEVYFTYEAA